jgi:Rrf2 family nitric oxide-sensitive transcriptional repressor
VPTTEIGRAYGISKNHLVRVAQSLRDGGFIELSPGRSGGLSLARPADRIRIGDVVRELEPDFRMVECFDEEISTCPISPACALAGALEGALDAFLAELDRFTLGQVIALSGPNLNEHFLPVEALVKGRRGRPANAAQDEPPARRRAASKRAALTVRRASGTRASS